MSAERTALLTQLAAQRRHVLAATEGLAEDQLMAAPLPSGWTIAAMVNHLAMDVEFFWFVCVLGGDKEAIASLEGDGWTVPSGLSGRDVVERYVACHAGHLDAARELVDGHQHLVL